MLFKSKMIKGWNVMRLTRLQKIGKELKRAVDKNGDTIKLIAIDYPYKNGDKYAVIENTTSPFCSSGVYKNINEALAKFNLMVKNANAIEI